MESAVYFLTSLTSFSCAILLYRGYRRRPSRLLFWSAACFAGLALSNVVLVIDLVFLPTTINLLPYRNVLTFSSLAVLLYGLVWDVV